MVDVGNRTGTPSFNCRQVTPESVFAAIFGTFSDTGTTAAIDWGTVAVAGNTPRRQTQRAKKKGGGVLPSVAKRIRKLPEVLTTPGLPRSAAASPPWIVGAFALVLLALSALAILFYVTRFPRGPGTA